MFFFLSKFLPLFVYPLGLACLLIVAAALARRWRWQWVLLALAFLAVGLGGNRWVAYGLVRSLEWRYLPPADLPAAPAIVVLGGATHPASFPRLLPEMSEAGDRLLYATWLYRQGKAPHILVSGGGREWEEPVAAEAETMGAILELMGVPADAIWVESHAINTYENATLSRGFLAAKDIDKILLVTSALHMPRSVRLFEQQGFDVIPAPADFLVARSDWANLFRLDWRNQLLQLVPDAENLWLTSLALKEYIGLIVYDLCGWL